jgi:phosphoribosylformylglycinamidine cyclo-ligase
MWLCSSRAYYHERVIRYQDAGVSIAEADRTVSSIKKLARATFTRGVLTEIGTFGASFALEGWKKPVLISSADGVGTKLKVAIAANRHDTVGECLVNHCVNDIAVQGAAPLFFLDYFASGKLDSGVAAQVISGVARGCKRNGCALIGGETAEMPGMYADGDYDIAGFIVGAAERPKVLNGRRVQAGDVLLGLASNGLHTNGYSLARKLFFDTAGYRHDTYVPELGATAAEELLKVHRSYLKPIRKLIEAGLLKGAAHITGGGITDNTPRMLPAKLAAVIRTGSWPVPPVFQLLRSIGDVPEDDWRRTFNLGIGMILCVGKKDAAEAGRALRRLKEPFFEIGEVAAQRRGGPRVEYR